MTHSTSLMMGWLPPSLGSFIRPLLYTGLPQKNVLWTWAGNWQKREKMELWGHFVCLSGKGDKGRYDWVLAEQKECRALIEKRGVDWFRFLKGNLSICGKIFLKLHTFWAWTSTFRHVLNGMHFSFFIKTEFRPMSRPSRVLITVIHSRLVGSWITFSFIYLQRLYFLQQTFFAGKIKISV